MPKVNANDLIYPGKTGKNKTVVQRSTQDTLSDSNKDATIIEVLKELSGAEEIGEKKRRELVKKLKSIYKDGYRHSYYSISVELYKMEEAQLDRLCTGIDYIKRALDYNDDAYNGIRKLYDHVNLEVVRIKENNERKAELYSISQETIGRITDAEKNMDRRMEQHNEQLDEARKNVNNIYAQIVGILGIFTAVVMVFFWEGQVFLLMCLRI
jgi:hypothetical protein